MVSICLQHIELPVTTTMVWSMLTFSSACLIWESFMRFLNAIFVKVLSLVQSEGGHRERVNSRYFNKRFWNSLKLQQSSERMSSRASEGSEGIRCTSRPLQQSPCRLIDVRHREKERKKARGWEAWSSSGRTGDHSNFDLPQLNPLSHSVIWAVVPFNFTIMWNHLKMQKHSMLSTKSS